MQGCGAPPAAAAAATRLRRAASAALGAAPMYPAPAARCSPLPTARAPGRRRNGADTDAAAAPGRRRAHGVSRVSRSEPEAAVDTADALRGALAAAQAASQAAKYAADAARAAAIAADDAADRAAAVLVRVEARAARAAPFSAVPALPPPPEPEAAPRVLPRRIFILRHGESQGNVDESMYCRVPDPEIALTRKGHTQAAEAGRRIKAICDADGTPYRLFFYISPYKRSKQTCAGVASVFSMSQVMGVREEPQLREQDFGNFQDSSALAREKAEREAYGRFFYRFPNGESGADVYDRITVFEDHLVRDIDTGRFPEGTHLVLVTHGLALRVFLARWFHWTTAEYESVYNPPNCTPLVMERSAADGGDEGVCRVDGSACDPVGRQHTKNLYRLSPESLVALRGKEEGLREMLQPEQAWRRTLGGADRGWADDDDEQCALPLLDYSAEGEE